MHSMYRHNDVERVCTPPQNGPRRDALAIAGAFATHPRAHETTLGPARAWPREKLYLGRAQREPERIVELIDARR